MSHKFLGEMSWHNIYDSLHVEQLLPKYGHEDIVPINEFRGWKLMEHYGHPSFSTENDMQNRSLKIVIEM